MLHRAVVNCNSERISIPTFYCPAPDAMIGPAKELINHDHLAMFRNFTYAEYFKNFWNRGLESECCLDLFKPTWTCCLFLSANITLKFVLYIWNSYWNYFDSCFFLGSLIYIRIQITIYKIWPWCWYYWCRFEFATTISFIWEYGSRPWLEELLTLFNHELPCVMFLVNIQVFKLNK